MYPPKDILNWSNLSYATIISALRTRSLVLAKRAHCDGPRIMIPLAADDAEAMDVAVQLVRDAGFDPVVVGDLSRARYFDYATGAMRRT